MNEEHQDTAKAIRELTEEVRKLHRTIGKYAMAFFIVFLLMMLFIGHIAR